MPSPADRRYKDTHEWHQLQPASAGAPPQVVVGLSDFAVAELTDITFVDIKVKSGPVRAGQTIGEVESVKATSDVYCGIDGTVTAVNQEVLDNPALLNEDPYGKAWLIKVQPADAAQLNKLLSAADYDRSHGH